MGCTGNTKCNVIISTALITVTIEDYNDNAPEFVPNNTYSLRVSEGREAGSEILRLETIDKDKDQGVSFEMGTNVEDSFNVDVTTGTVLTAAFNSLLNNKIFHKSRFKAFADNNLQVALLGRVEFILGRVENIEEKGERLVTCISPFHTMFSRAFY